MEIFFQELARAEVTKLLDRTGGKLDMSNTGELNYLERCIKESLRLFPPVSTIMRYTKEDLQLSNDQTQISIHSRNK